MKLQRRVSTRDVTEEGIIFIGRYLKIHEIYLFGKGITIGTEKKSVVAKDWRWRED